MYCDENNANCKDVANLVENVVTKDDITSRTPSGFYQTSSATTAEGWPVSTNNWYNLITSTHSNTANYFSIQFAGGFYDQDLYFRQTNNNGSQAWKKVMFQGDAITEIDPKVGTL
ncbi:TPA: hypothetical protein DEP21_03635, partial [Patescibacteria group bacterium]|nr:hypothetical protein [Candidatus Gracilibacteria bacterium]